MNFNNLKSITGHLKVYADTWHSLTGLPITQTEFFKTNIPDTETYFTDTFESKGLRSLFTSPKFTTRMLGSYNCNMLYRSVKNMPDVVIYSTDKFVVLHPLGEPGRDLGENHPFKICHLMVVPRMVSNEHVTLNEMLPTTPQETEEIQEKMQVLDMAYTALKENNPVSMCGDLPTQKVAELGYGDMGVRDMMASQIYEYLCKPPQRPGYKMMNVTQDKLLSKDSEQDIIDLVNIYSELNPANLVYCIQGPSDNSQLITHIHGFILQEGVIPDELKKSYICAKTILKAKRAYEVCLALLHATEKKLLAKGWSRAQIAQYLQSEMEPEPEQESDDDCGLTRQSTAAN